MREKRLHTFAFLPVIIFPILEMHRYYYSFGTIWSTPPPPFSFQVFDVTLSILLSKRKYVNAESGGSQVTLLSSCVCACYMWTCGYLQPLLSCVCSDSNDDCVSCFFLSSLFMIINFAFMPFLVNVFANLLSVENSSSTQDHLWLVSSSMSNCSIAFHLPTHLCWSIRLCRQFSVTLLSVCYLFADTDQSPAILLPVLLDQPLPENRQ